MNLLAQKKYPAVIIILAVAGLFAFSVIRPAVKYIQDQVLFYRPALNEHFPTVILNPYGGLSFKGEIPTIVTLQDSVQIFVDHQASDSLFEQAKPKSVFLSQEELWYKKKNDIWKSSLMDVTTDDGDSLYLDPIKVRQKIDDYTSAVTLIAFVIVTLLFFIGLWLLVLFAGGIGIMIDAFHVGMITYTQAVNFASYGLLFWIILAMLTRPKDLSIYFYYILFYFICTALGVFLMNTFIKQNE